jgi:hypothetical protein
VLKDAHRALELLEDYCQRLSSPADKQLRIAIEKVIYIFKSSLFQALLGNPKLTLLNYLIGKGKMREFLNSTIAYIQNIYTLLREDYYSIF